jgi:hypothetical protein
MAQFLIYKEREESKGADLQGFNKIFVPYSLTPEML